MKKYSKKALLANAFGSLGYMSCLALWGWAGMMYVPILLENKSVERLLLPSASEEIVTPAIPTEASPLLAAVAIGVTAVLLIITVIVLLRAPVTIARTGKTVTSKAATSALPLIARGKPLTPANKRLMTAGLIKLTKLLLATIPVAFGFLGLIVKTPLPFDVSMLVSSVLALFAVVWFSAQYGTARLLSVDPSKLV